MSEVKTIDDGGLAFPGTRVEFVNMFAGDTGPGTNSEVKYPGLSIRDWFAGQALAGMLAGTPGTHLLPTADKLGKEAYEAADALIAARKAGS